ncbi:glycosyltransferase family 4 protein [Peribacillus kribbensis]|uniref:glycosyltransferase family 4 protein n=1 Tax=Peribacillus kribbensis TaxID=356658 RepID=UPI00041230D2|nr:glycosyltransferase family 4 protein [Peribacillus kribbensis]
MKKVCLIGQFPPPIHGLSKALETIKESKYLKERFKFTHVDITNNKNFLAHLRNIRKNESDIYYFTISHSKLGNIRDLIILNQLIRKKKKTIIHYHGGYFRDLYNEMNFIQKRINRLLLNKVDNIVVLSKGLRSLFNHIVNESRIKICENYVEDKALLSDNELISKLEHIKGKKDLDILYLSNFIKSKGYIEVLKVAEIYRGKAVRFHFAGKFFSKKEEIEFKNYIIGNHLNNVNYYGVVDGDIKKELIKKSDVFILPTYYHVEGQPISLIEAMANGLTVITTKHAGIPDIVTSKNGYLLQPQSITDIDRAIEDIISDKTLLKKTGYYNREYTLANFKEIDYIKRIEKIFNEI